MRNQQGLPDTGDSLCGESTITSVYRNRKDRNCPLRETGYPRPNSSSLHWWESDVCSRDCSDCPVKRVRSTSFTYSPSYSLPEADSGRRVRSSSFTFIPTFPPCQKVRKNIFMPSTLSSTKTDTTLAVRSGKTTQRNVIRPAVLQPPQINLFPDGTKMVPNKVVEITENQTTCLTKETSSKKNVIEKFYPLAEHFLKAEKDVGSYNCAHVSNSKPPRRQPEEGPGTSYSTSTGFVFGENMEERVLSPKKSSDCQIEAAQYKRESALQTAIPQRTTNMCRTALGDSPAAFSSGSNLKIKLEKVETITGEEAERNVLQVTCRLFVFNKVTQSWTEKGRGSLRLNDTSSNGCGTLQSRLVMRNQGSLRLIFNTKLWAQMKIERANRKSLRITATDLEESDVRVFLIQAIAKDAGRLYAAIHHRLVALRISAHQDPSVSHEETDPETDIGLLNVDSDEDEDSLETTHFDSSRTDPPKWIRREPVMYL
ncbi:ran-binding protein 3-like isoform X2 [Pleurodeles waltl]|uniref:ran-binding protein 3-like isoform X2 n=1 Tax=Pleurodeles waltl TaxID=8319 RepID=UPI003709890C